MPAMSFEQWLTIVDHLMMKKTGGLGYTDMPDWCWWDLWDSELSPREAVEDYFENEGWFV